MCVLHPALEVLVGEGLPGGDGVGGVADVDVGERHAVEGVGLYHGIDCHVLEYEFLALGEWVVEAVESDDVAGEAGGPSEAIDVAGWGDAVGRGRDGCGMEKWWGVGHLDDVGHVACSGRVEYDVADSCGVGGLDLEYGGVEFSCIECHCLAGFEVDLEGVFFLHAEDASAEEVEVVARAGDVVAAAEVYPLDVAEVLAESVDDGIEGGLQVVGVLFAQCVEVESVDEPEQGRMGADALLEDVERCAQTASGGTGVVDGMSLLGGAFGIDAEAHLEACIPCLLSEPEQLGGGVEHDMVADAAYLVDVLFPVGGGEHVVFLSRHFLMAEACLEQPGGGGS